MQIFGQNLVVGCGNSGGRGFSGVVDNDDIAHFVAFYKRYKMRSWPLNLVHWISRKSMWRISLRVGPGGGRSLFV